MEFELNKKGRVIPPMVMNNSRFGIATFCLPVGYPLAVFLWTVVCPRPWPFEPAILQHTPTFWTLQTAGLLSPNDVATVEVVVLLHLLLRFASLPSFLRKFTSRLLQAERYPEELPGRWRFMICLWLILGGALIAFALSFGIQKELILLRPKYVGLLILILGGGIALLSEAVMSLCLYCVVARRFRQDIG